MGVLKRRVKHARIGTSSIVGTKHKGGLLYYVMRSPLIFDKGETSPDEFPGMANDIESQYAGTGEGFHVDQVWGYSVNYDYIITDTLVPATYAESLAAEKGLVPWGLIATIIIPFIINVIMMWWQHNEALAQMSRPASEAQEAAKRIFCCSLTDPEDPNKICGECFTTVAELIFHVQAVHGLDYPSCPYCGAMFNSQQALTNHMAECPLKTRVDEGDTWEKWLPILIVAGVAVVGIIIAMQLMRKPTPAPPPPTEYYPPREYYYPPPRYPPASAYPTPPLLTE